MNTNSEKLISGARSVPSPTPKSKTKKKKGKKKSRRTDLSQEELIKLKI